ncbi:MAG TPA: DinB family protein [Gemmatimonadaceae bacterium]|jgi:hypothetical protein
MSDYIAELREAIARSHPLLEKISDEQSRQRRAAGKWSPREIIGHLVDSASNNHQRFVRAQFQDSLLFPGYEQDAWVDRQGYHDAPWRELLSLWSSFNLHLARVMELTPTEDRTRPRTNHNLDQIAWKPIPKTEPATLDYFMADYVGHLKHHLAQILGPR